MFAGAAPSDCETATGRTSIARTDYNAGQITITDPAGKVRREIRDGLGRLKEVVEDPSGLNYSTTYSYDPLGNLTGVLQGVQPRTFAYSTLSQLRSAQNPESGTTLYTYKASGDLDTRTDSRGVLATFFYDGLHRIKPDTVYDYWDSGAAGCKNRVRGSSRDGGAICRAIALTDDPILRPIQ